MEDFVRGKCASANGAGRYCAAGLETEERGRSQGHLRSSKFRKSKVAEEPPSGSRKQGSNPGSSSAAASSHPPEKSAKDRELGRVEELFLEMMDIRESHIVEKSGSLILDEETFHFHGTSTMATRYRELTPGVRINFDERTSNVAMLIEGLNFDMPERIFLESFGRFKDHRY